jgi:thiol-disulfide isomerase/thioredoxin
MAVFFIKPAAYTEPVYFTRRTANYQTWLQYLYLAMAVLTALQLSQAASCGELVPFAQKPESPPLKLPDLSGQQHNISDYRGKVVLVNFWASWCQPCLQEMPSMQRLHEKMRDRPFSILAVDVEESKSKVWRFKKLLNISFTVLMDSKAEVARQWDTKIFPTSYLVDGEGRIRYGVRGALEWDSDEVNQLIETLLPKK